MSGTHDLPVTEQRPSHAPQPRPRPLWTVFLIGFLGPQFLMLWLGSATLALYYVLATCIMIVGFLLPILLNSEDAFAMPYYDWIWPCASWAILIAGLIHGLIIRRRALMRPWYSRWFVVLILYPLVMILLTFIFFQALIVLVG